MAVMLRRFAASGEDDAEQMLERYDWPVLPVLSADSSDFIACAHISLATQRTMRLIRHQ